MSYADVTALRARLGDIFDAIYDSGDSVAAVEDLADATAEIDGVIAKRYRVPVSAPESLALLKGWNLTLAEERSYSRAAGSDFAEKVKSRVALVRKYLADVAAGTFSLAGAEENGAQSLSVVSGEKPIFTRDQMRDY